jgi:hypothetical protein
MTQDEALRIAKTFVGALLEVEIASGSEAPYGFNPADEYLFRVYDPSRRVTWLGASRYVAVSKSRGTPRDAGWAGQ